MAGPDGRAVISCTGVRLDRGERTVLSDLDLTLSERRIGVIGANGAGKSTLFKMITGQEQPDSGSIDIGDTVHLGFVDQSRDDLNPKNNVWQEVSDELDYMKVNGHDMSTRAYVGAFNFKGADQQKVVGKLSGGERNRVHMAKMLKEGGNVLLRTSQQAYTQEEFAAITVITQADGTRITMNDPRRFGAMDLMATDAMDRHRLLAGIGPEPLGNAFNADHLAQRLAGRRTSIKAALLAFSPRFMARSN